MSHNTSTSFAQYVYVITHNMSTSFNENTSTSFYTIRLRHFSHVYVISNSHLRHITQQVDRPQRVACHSGGRDHILYGVKANPVWGFGTEVQTNLLGGPLLQEGADLCLSYALRARS